GVLPTFAKITLLRELCSSREACYLSLKKMHFTDQNRHYADSIIDQIEEMPQHTKAEKTLEIIKNIGSEKIIIFTEYRATQLYLQWYLQEHGITSVPYRGGFNSSRKDWMRHLFENHAQVLIATEAGGEGINLQFCNHMINYDLPWNPMRLEQRIGRIHRFGQKNDVYIYNIAIRHTFEEHIMTLLYEKIAMFENVIGNLDDILAELQLTDMETEMNRIFSESTSQGEIKIKMDNLSSVIHDKYKQISSEGE
ncbi:MAG TPA: helicase-related protein, partial [Bacillota bacterium]|nr:helicase-related protein [Bacillota bacterium]